MSFEEDDICPTCNGSGEGMYDGTRCHVCGGSGESRMSRAERDAERADYEYDAWKERQLWRELK